MRLVATIVLLLSAFQVSANASDPPRTAAVAKGSFEVKILPDGEPQAEGGVALGRMTFEKAFSGDLAGTGKGTMLTAMTGTQGSAGYVAIERVTGTLHGKKGSFVLQHGGTMNRGAQNLSIAIVPDSGTGELSGIEGVFKLTIAEGKHLYELEYSLPK